MRTRAITLHVLVLLGAFLLADCWNSPEVPATLGDNPDTKAPVVTLASPQDGATVSGMVTIAADASDDTGVKFVEFFADQIKLANSTIYNPPYEYQWDTSSLASGSNHVIYAKATDTSGNKSNSQAVTVTIGTGGGGDTTPPTVSITDPADNSIVSGTITIVADATDDAGIDSVEFFLDGAKMNDGVEYNYPYEQWWDTTVHPDGSVHTILTKATDTSGNVAYSDTVHVTVNNGGGQPLATDANVIVLVIDGARYTETFGDSTYANVKFMWNYMVPQGSFFTSFRNEGATKTNPGHSSIATGTWQYVANDGTERPTMPTFFEYLRKDYTVQQSETYMVAGKAKLNICSYGTYAGYGSIYGSSVDAVDRSDVQTYQALVNHLQTDHPRLTFVNFASVDRMGHTGVWADYISAIQTADSLTYELWQFIQNDTFYSGKTYLFITNDHGRHSYDFTSHGDGCEGCRHIMALVLGPTIKQGYVVTSTYTQRDICPTVASIFGFSAPQSAGTPISEIFSVAPAPAVR